MRVDEYEELKTRLLNKRVMPYTNRDEGYNEGILTAVSMLREVYNRDCKVKAMRKLEEEK